MHEDCTHKLTRRGLLQAGLTSVATLSAGPRILAQSPPVPAPAPPKKIPVAVQMVSLNRE